MNTMKCHVAKKTTHVLLCVKWLCEEARREEVHSVGFHSVTFNDLPLGSLPAGGLALSCRRQGRSLQRRAGTAPACIQTYLATNVRCVCCASVRQTALKGTQHHLLCGYCH